LGGIANTNRFAEKCAPSSAVTRTRLAPSYT
jgi:hypothetical protein